MKLQDITDTIGGVAVGVAIASGVAALFMMIAVGGALSDLVEKNPRSVDKQKPKSTRSMALSHSF